MNNLIFLIEDYCALDFVMNCCNEIPDKVDGEHSNHPALEMILGFKPDLNKRHYNGRTLLYWAIHKHWDEVAITLINAGAIVNDISKHKDDDGITLLAKAIQLRQTKTVRALLQNGSNPNQSFGKQNDAPLHVAVKVTSNIESKIEIVKVLLNFGALVAKPNKKGQTALHLACYTNRGTANCSTEVEELLLDNGADVFNKDYMDRLPLHYSFMNYNCSESTASVDPIELLTLLSSSMGNKNLDTCDKNGQTPLHRAAIRGATVCCMHLLERSAKLNRKDNYSNTPLSYAVAFRHESCILTLMQKDADINCGIQFTDHILNCVRDQDNSVVEKESDKEIKILQWKPLRKPVDEKGKLINKSLFHLVVESNLTGVAYLMLDLFPKFNMKFFDALIDICKTKSFRFILTLLHKKKDLNVLEKSADNKTLLHYLACESDDLSNEDLFIRVADALAQKGITIDAKDDNGCTFLHYCAIYGGAKLLDHLISKYKLQRIINQKDKFNRTLVSSVIFASAITKKSPIPTLRSLIKHKADFNTTFSFPEIPRLYGEDHDRMSCQTSLYKLFKDYTNNITPLIYAILVNDLELVQFLIKEGKADINFSDPKGKTPLMHAVNFNNIRAVQILYNPSHPILKNNSIYGPLDINFSQLAPKNSKKPSMKKKDSRIFKLGRKCKNPKVDSDRDDDGDDDIDENSDEEEEDNNPYSAYGCDQSYVIPWPKYSKDGK